MVVIFEVNGYSFFDYGFWMLDVELQKTVNKLTPDIESKIQHPKSIIF